MVSRVDLNFLMNIMKRILLIFSGLTVFFLKVRAQQLKLGDNPFSIDKSALLQLDSKNQGLLLPRITDTTSATLNTAPDGMIIFFPPDSSLLVRKGGSWAVLADIRNLYHYETDPIWIADSSRYYPKTMSDAKFQQVGTSWLLDGNNLTAARNFGTTTGYDLPFITSNTERMRILANGNVGINTSTPGAKLDVEGNFQLGTIASSGSTTGPLNNIFRAQITITGSPTVPGINVLIATPGSLTLGPYTVTGVKQNATIVANPETALPAGIGIGWVQANAANQVTINLINANTSGTQITSNLKIDIAVIQ